MGYRIIGKLSPRQAEDYIRGEMQVSGHAESPDVVRLGLSPVLPGWMGRAAMAGQTEYAAYVDPQTKAATPIAGDPGSLEALPEGQVYIDQQGQRRRKGGEVIPWPEGKRPKRLGRLLQPAMSPYTPPVQPEEPRRGLVAAAKAGLNLVRERRGLPDLPIDLGILRRPIGPPEDLGIRRGFVRSIARGEMALATSAQGLNKWLSDIQYRALRARLSWGGRDVDELEKDPNHKLAKLARESRYYGEQYRGQTRFANQFLPLSTNPGRITWAVETIGQSLPQFILGWKVAGKFVGTKLGAALGFGASVGAEVAIETYNELDERLKKNKDMGPDERLAWASAGAIVNGSAQMGMEALGGVLVWMRYLKNTPGAAAYLSDSVARSLARLAGRIAQGVGTEALEEAGQGAADDFIKWVVTKDPDLRRFNDYFGPNWQEAWRRRVEEAKAGALFGGVIAAPLAVNVEARGFLRAAAERAVQEAVAEAKTQKEAEGAAERARRGVVAEAHIRLWSATPGGRAQAEAILDEMARREAVGEDPYSRSVFEKFAPDIKLSALDDRVAWANLLKAVYEPPRADQTGPPPEPPNVPAAGFVYEPPQQTPSGEMVTPPARRAKGESGALPEQWQEFTPEPPEGAAGPAENKAITLAIRELLRKAEDHELGAEQLDSLKFPLAKDALEAEALRRKAVEFRHQAQDLQARRRKKPAKSPPMPRESPFAPPASPEEAAARLGEGTAEDEAMMLLAPSPKEQIQAAGAQEVLGQKPIGYVALADKEVPVYPSQRAPGTYLLGDPSLSREMTEVSAQDLLEMGFRSEPPGIEDTRRQAQQLLNRAAELEQEADKTEAQAPKKGFPRRMGLGDPERLARRGEEFGLPPPQEAAREAAGLRQRAAELRRQAEDLQRPVPGEPLLRETESAVQEPGPTQPYGPRGPLQGQGPPPKRLAPRKRGARVSEGRQGPQAPPKEGLATQPIAPPPEAELAEEAPPPTAEPTPEPPAAQEATPPPRRRRAVAPPAPPVGPAAEVAPPRPTKGWRKIPGPDAAAAIDAADLSAEDVQVSKAGDKWRLKPPQAPIAQEGEAEAVAPEAEVQAQPAVVPAEHPDYPYGPLPGQVGPVQETPAEEAARRAQIEQAKEDLGFGPPAESAKWVRETKDAWKRLPKEQRRRLIGQLRTSQEADNAADVMAEQDQAPDDLAAEQVLRQMSHEVRRTKPDDPELGPDPGGWPEDAGKHAVVHEGFTPAEKELRIEEVQRLNEYEKEFMRLTDATGEMTDTEIHSLALKKSGLDEKRLATARHYAGRGLVTQVGISGPKEFQLSPAPPRKKGAKKPPGAPLGIIASTAVQAETLEKVVDWFAKNVPRTWKRTFRTAGAAPLSLWRAQWDAHKWLSSQMKEVEFANVQLGDAIKADYGKPREDLDTSASLAWDYLLKGDDNVLKSRHLGETLNQQERRLGLSAKLQQYRRHIAQLRRKDPTLSQPQAESQAQSETGVTPLEIREAEANITRLGDIAGLQFVPQKTADAVARLRLNIDTLSRVFRLSGLASADLQAVIEKREGKYVARLYQIHTTPDFTPSQQAQELFKVWMRSEYPKMTEANIDQWTEILSTPKEGRPPIGEFRRLPGRMNLARIKRRKDIPQPLRELWGEHHDVFYNYTATSISMARTLANNLFLKEAAAMGALFSPPVKKGETPANREHTVQISKEGDKSLSPLDGHWTSPEILQTMRDLMDSHPIGKWVGLWIKAAGLVKFGKTVLNLQTHFRNFEANISIAVANIHAFDKDAFAKTVKLIGSDIRGGRGSMTASGPLNTMMWVDGRRHTYQDIIKDLHGLGVLGEEVSVQEAKDVLRDVFQQNPVDATQLHEMFEETIARKGKKYAEKFYRAEDAFFKILGYQVEYKRYRAALSQQDMSDAQLRRHVAELITNLYPTYSKLPPMIRSLRRNPLIASFPSFAAEMFRTTYYLGHTIQTELRNPKLRKIGMQRLAGSMFSVFALPTGLTRAGLMAFGITSDDEDDMRWFTAPWEQNSDLVTVRKKGLEFTVVDLSFLLPHSYMRDPFRALARGEDWTSAVWAAVVEGMRPFAEPDILTKSVWEAVNNDKGGGAKVYNREATGWDKLWAMSWHVEQRTRIGFLNSFTRIYKSLAGEAKAGGKTYHTPTEAMAMLGPRFSTYNIAQSLQFKTDDLNDRFIEASNMTSAALTTKGTTTPEKIQQQYEKGEAARKKVFKEAHDLAWAAIRQGMPVEDVEAALRSSHFSQPNARRIIAGQYVPYRPSRGTLQITPPHRGRQAMEQYLSTGPVQIEARQPGQEAQKAALSGVWRLPQEHRIEQKETIRWLLRYPAP